MDLPDPEAMEELDSKLEVILGMLVDRTGLAELRGDELWYRTSRHGVWMLAVSVSTALVEHHRDHVLELLEAFNGSVAQGRARHDLPELVPLPKGRLPANTFEVDHVELVAEVVRAAMQATSRTDRWAPASSRDLPLASLVELSLRLGIGLGPLAPRRSLRSLLASPLTLVPPLSLVPLR